LHAQINRGRASAGAVIFNELAAALVRNDRVELRGFGAFAVKRHGARIARNPRTGDVFITRSANDC